MIAAAVLAAGRGERFGGDTPKPLVAFRGRPLVLHALDAAGASGLAPVLLIVGNGAEAVAAVVPPTVEVVRNDAWASGIASSLVSALGALRHRDDVDAVVIGLADQPLVGADAYRRLAAAYDDGARLAVATYGGTRGNPVLLARAHWEEAMTLTGDEGARVLLGRHPAVEVSCDGTGSPTDVDTPADLAALEG
ncbi:MAG: molybdenum cofactor cytidylyltransferase / molybdopterin molybdochelatase [Actinomycetia bacterium]|nr:molybdenum cofactor cytidylyltransferase / molybdopterin molybdochelatase [Actinomycetes bacterium]